MKICPPVFAVGDDKKKEREGKGRCHTKSQKGYISAIWRADHLGPISTKISSVEGAHDIIILSNFGFNILGVSDLLGGQNIHFPFDFAGHRYNSAACDKRQFYAFNPQSNFVT